MKIDYVGLGFVALGLGTLQIILDKGQRDDWFESHFILALSIISAASLLFVIWWEWRQKDPVIDLHLFRERTSQQRISSCSCSGLPCWEALYCCRSLCRRCSDTQRSKPGWRSPRADSLSWC